MDTDADELLQGPQQQGREKVQFDAAKAFLEEALSNGPSPSTDLKGKAEKAGLAWRTVWRAKEALKVKATKERGSGEWFWRLP